MDFIKKLFKEDDRATGLCQFRRQTVKTYSFKPELNTVELFYSTNTKNNFLLS